MQLPLTLRMYLVGCPSVSGDAVRAALADFNEASRGLAPAFDELEVIEAESLDEDMHGYAILLGDESLLDAAVVFTGDTAVATVGASKTASELMALGFAAALPADADDDRIQAAIINLAREALLRRRFDIRQYAFDTYFRISDNMMWTKDLRDFHMDVNHYLTKLTGKPLSDIEGLHEVEVYGLDPNDPGCGESDRLVRETCKESYFEESMPDFDGVQHHLDVVKAPWFDGQGRLVGTIGIGKDTTDLLNQQARFETFLNSLGIAVVITDNEDRFVQANDTFFSLVDNDVTEGEHISELVDRHFRRSESDVLTHEVAPTSEEDTSFDEGDYVLTNSDDPRIWNVDRFFLRDFWEEHTGFTYIFQDVTEDRAQRSAIQELAVTDSLTGVSNRAGLYAFFDSVDPAAHGTFLFVDIDDFKHINDGLGHAKGDQHLREVTKLLTRVLDDSAHISRYGGDEFFAIIPQAHSDEEAAVLAERILEGARGLTARSELGGEVGSLSIGIVSDAPFSDGIDRIIRRCDRAMYEAKNSGKNRYCLA